MMLVKPIIILLVSILCSIAAENIGSFELTFADITFSKYLLKVKPLNEEKFLNLSSLEIDLIDVEAFSEASQITHLDLSDNKVFEFPTYVFSNNLTNLEYLTVANYKRSIHITGQFRNLNKLKVLDLSGTYAVMYDETPFIGLPDECEIKAPKNMKTINPKMFHKRNPYLNDYDYLTAHNCFWNVPDSYQNLLELQNVIKRKQGLSKGENINATVCITDAVVKNVEPNNVKEGCEQVNFTPESLSLNNKNIKTFGKNWYSLSDYYNLWELIIENNEITEIDQNLLNDLPQTIRIVSLRGNQIKGIKNRVIANNYLTKLDLSENDIDVIEDSAFRKTPSLTELSLNQNGINNLSFVSNLPASLVRLELSKNKISNIPENVFSQLTNLYFLDLSHNLITSLNDKTFVGLGRLNTLNLEHNSMAKIHKGVFDELHCAQELVLSGNPIETIEEGFARNLNNIENLYLNESVKVVNYENGLLHGLPSTSTVYISSNVKSIFVNVFGNETTKSD